MRNCRTMKRKVLLELVIVFFFISVECRSNFTDLYPGVCKMFDNGYLRYFENRVE